MGCTKGAATPDTPVRPFQGWLPAGLRVVAPGGLSNTLGSLWIPPEMRAYLEVRRLPLLHSGGEFHDQGDAEWIVIRGQLRGLNDTPFKRPTPGRPVGHPGVGRPQGVVGGLSYIN
jgi:hypothetical protein